MIADNLKSRPLAFRMRPNSLEEMVGQEHLTNTNGLFSNIILNDCFHSLIFYGPAGTGKTSLAEIVAQKTRKRFISINAVLSNSQELKSILKKAREYKQANNDTILFIDEFHRFNRSQQDLLLPDVEQGNINLIGATTYNPGFYIINPLLSRSQVIYFKTIDSKLIFDLLKRVLVDKKRGLAHYECQVHDKVLEKIARSADGDIRRALNLLEILVMGISKGSVIDETLFNEFCQQQHLQYDKNEDEHYNTISAFIKSLRGNDPDASMYWLFKMLLGGEDPRFIARRMIIFASEDIGLADSRALLLANACSQVCESVGMPECEYNLSHTAIFLATAVKNNSVTLTMNSVKKELKNNAIQKVPLHLQDSHAKLNPKMRKGKHYRYSHDYFQNISGQDYLQKSKVFYHPKGTGAELAIKERVKYWRALKKKIQDDVDDL